MFTKIRLAYRILTSKCIICGEKRLRKEGYSYIYAYVCHYCNKMFLHGSNYGMPKEKLIESINSRYHN